MVDNAPFLGKVSNNGNKFVVSRNMIQGSENSFTKASAYEDKLQSSFILQNE